MNTPCFLASLRRRATTLLLWGGGAAVLATSAACSSSPWLHQANLDGRLLRLSAAAPTASRSVVATVAQSSSSQKPMEANLRISFSVSWHPGDQGTPPTNPAFRVRLLQGTQELVSDSLTLDAQARVPQTMVLQPVALPGECLAQARCEVAYTLQVEGEPEGGTVDAEWSGTLDVTKGSSGLDAPPDNLQVSLTES